MINLMKYYRKALFAHKRMILLIGMVSIIIIGTCFRTVEHEKAMDVAPIRIGVINEDKSKESNILIQSFRNNIEFSKMISIEEGTKEEIYRKFEMDQLDVSIEIPENFVKNMMYINNPPMKVKINGRNTAKTLILKNVFQSYEKYIKAVEINAVGLSDIMEHSGVNKELIKKKNMEISISFVLTILGKEQLFKMEQIESYPSTSIGHYYFLSILYIMLFYGSFRAGLDMIEELRNGMLKRMKVTGVFIPSVICSKIFVLAALLFLIFIIPFCLITSIMKIEISFLAVLYIVTFFIMLGGLSVLFSAVAKSKEKFLILFHIFGFIGIVFGGGIIPIMYLPKQFLFVSKVMPNYWFTKGFLHLEKGYETGIIYFLILLLIIIAEIFAAALLYEKNEA